MKVLMNTIYTYYIQKIEHKDFRQVLVELQQSLFCKFPRSSNRTAIIFGPNLFDRIALWNYEANP